MNTKNASTVASLRESFGRHMPGLGLDIGNHSGEPLGLVLRPVTSKNSSFDFRCGREHTTVPGFRFTLGEMFFVYRNNDKARIVMTEFAVPTRILNLNILGYHVDMPVSGGKSIFLKAIKEAFRTMDENVEIVISPADELMKRARKLARKTKSEPQQTRVFPYNDHQY